MEAIEKSSRKHSLWCAAAMLAPMTQAASSAAWPGVLAAAVVAWLLSKCSVPARGWVLTAQRVWAALIAGQILRWSTVYWERLPFGFIVPFVLLALAMWTVSAPGKAARVGCVLLWPLVFLLGAVLLSGVSEIQLEYLSPEWEFPDMAVFTFALLPALHLEKKQTGITVAGAVLVSAVTTGVLSLSVSKNTRSGIYELSRSLSLLGVAERFESLIAAAMTMGFYTAVSYLLDTEDTEKKNAVWLYGAIACGWYLLAFELEGWMTALGTVLAWVILPWFADRKIFSKKERKRG